MQNKTTSAFVDSPTPAPHPLAGIHGIQTIRDHARRFFIPPHSTASFPDGVCRLVERLFTGRLWSFQPIDLRYHDFLHTLQAAKVFLDLAYSAKKNLSAGKCPTTRQLELGFAAILLHDTGYLKARGDDDGSGAKYTHCHVLRSCALAASILPSLGCQPAETQDVLGAIRSTGIEGNPAEIAFSDDAARLVACMVATSDYLGQMAAPEYPAKLPYLFAEFEEADNYSGTPSASRPFKSPLALMTATASFWHSFVLPRLQNDYAGVYRLLAVPHPSGPNPYVTAIEQNIATIVSRITNYSPGARA